MLTSKSSPGIVKSLYPVRSVQIGVTLHDSSAEYWKEHLIVIESFCCRRMFSESENSSTEHKLTKSVHFKDNYE